jgi:hypothetical protein
MRRGITEYAKAKLGPSPERAYRPRADLSNAYAVDMAHQLVAAGETPKRAAMRAAAEYLCKWTTVHRRMYRGYVIDVVVRGKRKRGGQCVRHRD